MRSQDKSRYLLQNFEGPLPFLLQLVQREELDIAQVALQILTEQFHTHYIAEEESDVDEGAEFISVLASLLLLKSRSLLPMQEEILLEQVEEEDSPLQMIPHLIEYCRFKEITQELTEREEQQMAFYSRGCDWLREDPKKKMGIEHVSLTEFSHLFQQILQRASSRTGTIYEEIWRVADKLIWMRHRFKEKQKLFLGELFPVEKSRDELIVTFLAILEMMKLGELRIVREKNSTEIWIEAAHG